MNKAKSFIFAWALTTAILTANVFIKADEGKKEVQQEPVSSLSTVVIDGCNVSATLALQENAIQAVMMVTNPTDAEITIDVNYQVQNTPTMSPLSRMGPMPVTRGSGTYSLTLAAGKSVEKTVTVAPRIALEDQSLSGTWTFIVSRDEIVSPLIGAGAPVVTQNLIPLTKGTAVLASLQLTKPLTNALIISTP
jgi:hypothetical protein